MIVFEGKVSKRCFHYIRRKANKWKLSHTLLSMIIEIVIVVWGWNMISKMMGLSGKSITIFFSIAVVAWSIYLHFASFDKNAQAKAIPLKITISDDNIIMSEGKEFQEARSIQDVVAVFDMGEWYHISFGKKLGLGRFVCQKDLLVQGTIEDFEKLFEGKIIRK